MNVTIFRNADYDTPEDLDTFVQVESVSDSLKRLGHTVNIITCTLDLQRMYWAHNVVFNLIESIGDDALAHLAPAVLESLGTPYTGCRADSIYQTSNKILAKRMMQWAGIQTPHWIDQSCYFNGKYIVKDIWNHGSRGLSTGEGKIVLSKRQFAESFIEGREFNVSMLNGVTLPPAEIVFSDGQQVVDHAAKWNPDSFEFKNTNRSFDIEQMLAGRLRRIASACWDLFKLRGYARVDFRMGKWDDLYVLEVNANPCLSPDAGFVAALDRAHISYDTAIAEILSEST